MAAGPIRGVRLSRDERVKYADSLRTAKRSNKRRLQPRVQRREFSACSVPLDICQHEAREVCHPLPWLGNAAAWNDGARHLGFLGSSAHDYL
jgi:hypothetical protein